MTKPSIPALPRPTFAVPSLPQLPRVSMPNVQLPSRDAVVRTAKAALPWAVIAGECALLLLPLAAPYLAPAIAAQLLAAAPYLAIALGLVA